MFSSRLQPEQWKRNASRQKAEREEEVSQALLSASEQMGEQPITSRRLTSPKNPCLRWCCRSLSRRPLSPHLGERLDGSFDSNCSVLFSEYALPVVAIGVIVSVAATVCLVLQEDSSSSFDIQTTGRKSGPPRPIFLAGHEEAELRIGFDLWQDMCAYGRLVTLS